jgi:hypothetical protein
MTRDTLTKQIEASQALIKDDVRNYIGASLIGSDCLRQIWYEYKGYPSIGVPTKTRRTWAIGKHLEGLILDWIEDAGIKISRIFNNFEDSLSPLKGHADAILIEKGIPVRIIEIKTAKDASFRIFCGKGLKEWNKQYYSQVQTYMGMSGAMGAYMFVLNKDNSDISDEFIPFDEEHYQMLQEKASMIARAELPPPKINGSPLFYKCKMCKFNKVCHK